jgi:putative transcriptional regulator
MIIGGNRRIIDGRESLDGQFLVAMPGMADERFSRTVIYICSHGPDGAMGLVINRLRPIRFPELLVQLGVIEESEIIQLPERARQLLVRSGGPVEQSRGFVVHSDDYVTESSVLIDNHILLTATVDILRAISEDGGPRQAFMALGYSGWGPGQLESEIAENGWLTVDADPEILFDRDLDRAYERVLAGLGIDPTHLSSEAGHA